MTERVNAEAGARVAADGALQNAINAEAAARVAADGALQGLPGYEFVQNTVLGPFGGSVVVQVECPAGKVPLSGGLFLSVDAKVVRSIPFANPDGTAGWEIEARGDNPLVLGAGSAVGVNALCVTGP